MSEELLIKIGVENKNATAQIRALENSVKSLDRQLKLTSGSGNLMEMSLSQLSSRYTTLTSKMKYLQTELRSYKTRLADANDNIARQQSLMKELAATGQENSTAYNRAASQLSKYKQEAEKTENGIAELEAKIKLCNQEIKTTETLMKNHSLLTFGQRAKELGSTLQDVGVKVQNLGRGIETVGHTIGTLATPFTLITAGAAAAAIAYEDAFAGVRKTVGATEQQFQQLSDSIRNMSKEMPTSANDIAAVAEAAGQLGVKIESIEDFTKVMVMLGDTTNISCTDAATAMAKFMNVTGNVDSTTKEYTDKVERLGSVLVHLGNNTATTEQDIMNMATRLASAGHQVGMSEQQIFALSAALSSVGLEAEMGGSAFSKLMIKMQVACEEGGESLADFEKIAGADFKQTFEQDAYGAMMKFVQGLAAGGEQGESAIKMLSDMGIEEVRLRDAILRATNANELFTNVLDLANEAYEENSALSDEAAKRYETVASQIEIFKNKVYDLGIQLGEQLLPHIRNFINKAEDLVEWFGNLDEGTQGWILKLGVMLPLIAGGVTIIGKFTKGIGSVITGVGSLTELLGNWAIKQATVTTATSGMATALGTVASASTGAATELTAIASTASVASSSLLPLVGVLGAAAVVIGGIGIAWANNEKKCKEGARQLSEAGIAAEDMSGKVKGANNIIDEMFGHEFDIKFSDSYKTATKQIEDNVTSWADRLEELQQNIYNTLNSTEIDQGTKTQQIQTLVQPWVEELTTGSETISNNQKEMLRSVMDYAKETFGKGTDSYRDFIKGYQDFSMNYKEIYDQNSKELLEIYSKLQTGEIEMTEETQQHILDLRMEMVEAEKNLQLTSADDYINQLKLNGEKENAVYEQNLENINKYTLKKRQAEEESIKATTDNKLKEIEALRMSGAISKAEADQYIEDVLRKEDAQLKWASVSANSFGAMALYSKEFAEQHGLHVEMVEGDIAGLFEVYDSNGNKINTVFAQTTTALQQYAREHGYATSTITNEHGAMAKVVMDENNNVIAQLADNEWAWKNNAESVVDAVKTEIDSVKSGATNTDAAMEKIKAKLKAGEIAAGDFGFTSEEAFLACAREAVNCGGDVDTLKRSCDNLPDDVRINVTDNGTAKNVKWRIDEITGKSVTIDVYYKTHGLNRVNYHYENGVAVPNEQGSHGTLGAEQLAYVNESARNSRAWELVDGPHTYLGRDSIGDKLILGQGASVKSNITSTQMMMQAVQEEVQKQLADVYLDYAMSSSPLSRMAFDLSVPQQTVNNNTNFDDSNIVGALYELLKAMSGINFNPTISFSPKQLAKSLAPHVDKELQWRSSKR